MSSPVTNSSAVNKVYVEVSDLCSSYATPGYLPVYVVQSGDTLSAITERFYQSTHLGCMNALAWWNCLNGAGATLDVGYPLQLPHGLFLEDTTTSQCYEYFLNMNYVGSESSNSALSANCISSGSCCNPIFDGKAGIGLDYGNVNGWGNFGSTKTEQCP